MAPLSELKQLPVQKDQLKSWIEQMNSTKVLIIGDVGLDEYLLGRVRRISPEAPVPVLEVDKQETRLGLSGNVAQNISSLGGKPILLAVVGADAAADKLRGLLKENAVDVDQLVVDESRPTTLKTRVMAGHNHIVRVDHERRQFIDAKVEEELLKNFRKVLTSVDVVILQDYAKGVVTESLSQKVISEAHAQGKKVLVDPHRSSPLTMYKGADLMTPNHDESLSLAGYQLDDLRSDPDYIDRVGKKLLEEINGEQMIITLGSDGMQLFENQKAFNLPTFARQVFDVTGAGDTVIASLALAWAAGLSLREACVLANLAAGVVVGKVGCVPCYAADLPEYLDGINEGLKA